MFSSTIRYFRSCNVCGAPLAYGEACACTFPLRTSSGPHDGLRAACGCFCHRSSYRGRHYINCRIDDKARKIVFATQADRDEHYVRFCCNGSACARCDLRKGGTRDDDV